MHKEGTDIIFAPGIARQLGGEDDAGSEEAHDTFHTTCIVCEVSRGKVAYEVESNK